MKIHGYIVSTYLLSICVGIFAAAAGGVASDAARAALYLNGWVPALAAVVARLAIRQGLRDVGWGFRQPRMLLVAVVPPVVFALGFLGAYCVSPFPVLQEGTAVHATVRFAVGALANAIFVFGEEFGWRGYLQQHVVARLDAARGLLVMSLIWAFWHAPLDFLGMGYPGINVFIAALVLRPLAFVGLGMLVGWVYLRTRSLWAACLVHGANNAIGGQIGSIVDVSSAQNSTGLVLLSIVYCAVGIAIYLHLRKSTVPGETKEQVIAAA